VRTPTDVGRLVTKATALLEARARARGVQLAVEAAPGLPLLDLDSDLVTQVVVNLVTNALDAVKDGGKVKVTVEPFPDRDGVALSVTDDGEGIPEESRARVFEPFFTTKHGGTGLGLPLCHRIVNEHGGTMTLESETGRGTTFVALFPSRDVPARRRAMDRGVNPAG
jgi:signal transduction histidine kinase